MDRNIVKECMMEGVSELCPEKLNLFKMISPSRNTVAYRIDDIGDNIPQQITGKAQRFTPYSLAMDESTDVGDTSQLLSSLFVELTMNLISFKYQPPLTACTALQLEKISSKKYKKRWQNITWVVVSTPRCNN